VSSKKPPKPPLILQVFMVIGILLVVVSAFALSLAYQAYLNGDSLKTLYHVVIGAGGLALAGYLLAKVRFRAVSLVFPEIDVVTVLECPKCKLKKIRRFETGDYVFKKADKCDRCSEVMIVTQIFSREKKGEMAKLG